MDNILKEDSDPFIKSVAVMMSIILIATMLGAAYEFYECKKEKEEINETHTEEGTAMQLILVLLSYFLFFFHVSLYYFTCHCIYLSLHIHQPIRSYGVMVTVRVFQCTLQIT